MSSFGDPTVLYWLNLDGKIDHQYINFSQQVKEQGIKLIPVSVKDLTEFSKNKVVSVVINVNSLTRKNKFDLIFKKYIGFAVQSKRLRLHLISSFSRPIEDKFMNDRAFFNFYALPIKYTEITEQLAKNFVNRDSESNKWIGGRRAMLDKNNVL